MHDGSGSVSRGPASRADSARDRAYLCDSKPPTEEMITRGQCAQHFRDGGIQDVARNLDCRNLPVVEIQTDEIKESCWVFSPSYTRIRPHA